MNYETKFAAGALIMAMVVASCGAAQSVKSTAQQSTARGASAAAGVSPSTPASGQKSRSDDPREIVVQRAELNALIADTPAATQALVMKTPAKFLELMEKVLAEPKALTILVDKHHALPAGYVPPDLVSLNHRDLTLYKNNLFLREIALPDLLAMVHASRVAHTDLPLASTYRSYALQKEIFAWEVKTYGLKQAERESAHPGTSQHQLGTAIDFGNITEAFAHTKAGEWIAAHGWQYGFTMSYPKGYESVTGYMYEPWHFRYIGRAAAKMEHEYFGGIQQYLLVFLHNRAAEFAKLLDKD